MLSSNLFTLIQGKPYLGIQNLGGHFDTQKRLKNTANLYPAHNNSSVHLTTITEVRRSGRITNRMWSGWRTLRNSVVSSSTSAPTLLEWTCHEQRDPLNRLCTGVGRFRYCLHNKGMAPWTACECGAEEQTVDPVVLQCLIHRRSHVVRGLTDLVDETIGYLLNICPKIAAPAVDQNSLKRWRRC